MHQAAFVPAPSLRTRVLCKLSVTLSSTQPFLGFVFHYATVLQPGLEVQVPLQQLCCLWLSGLSSPLCPCCPSPELPPVSGCSSTLVTGSPL